MKKEEYNIIETEFYSQLGRLSVKFAKLELNITELIVIIANSDDEIISRSLVEKNSISQNIEKLRKIIPFRFQEEELIEIESLIKDIDRVRKDRNLFMHGDWGNPIISGSKVSIMCDERKVKYPKKNQSDQTYFLNTIHEFTLEEIKERITEIDRILQSQDKINERLFNEIFLR